MTSKAITAAQRRLAKVPVPSGWERIYLGDIFDPIVDTGHKQDLPVLSVTIGGNIVRRSSLDRRSEREVAREKYLRVMPGDIAYNTMRMWQGASGLIEEEGYISPSYTVCRPRESECPRFWSKCFQSATMIRAFRDHSQGFAKDRYRLYYQNFATVPALRPPLIEQVGIATVLSSVEDSLTSTEALSGTINTLKEALVRRVLTENFHGQLIQKLTRKGFADLVEPITPPAKVQKTEYQLSGSYPVIDQGQKFIAGYTNNESAIYRETLPVIVFGDHTREFKFVDFPFACGADGVKLLVPRGHLDPKFVYYLLASRPLISLGYSRHFKLLRDSEFDVPSLEVQKKISQLLSSVDEAIEQTNTAGNAQEALKVSLLQCLLSGEIRVQHSEPTYDLQ